MLQRSPIAVCASLLLIATTLTAAPVKDTASAGVVSRIKRAPVNSMAIASVGYSKQLRALEIEFRNGAIYRYLDVERSVYRKFTESDSKAQFYHKNVRGKYRSLRVKGRGDNRARASR